MSSWKLVEAEAIGPSSNGNNNAQVNNGNNLNNGRRRERRRSGGGRKYQREQDTPESRQYYAHLAVQTMEFFFSPDSLISDPTIRSYLDEAGYIPIAFVCNFPEVLAIGAYFEDILAALQNSSLFEVDLENETMRLHDWQKWLMPNGLGGFGLPRYMKQSMEYTNSEEVYENTDVESPAGETQEDGQFAVQPTGAPRTGGADQELSPNASEFKPNPSA